MVTGPKPETESAPCDTVSVTLQTSPCEGCWLTTCEPPARSSNVSWSSEGHETVISNSAPAGGPLPPGATLTLLETTIAGTSWLYQQSTTSSPKSSSKEKLDAPEVWPGSSVLQPTAAGSTSTVTARQPSGGDSVTS